MPDPMELWRQGDGSDPGLEGGIWYAREDSNLRPLAPQASALSAELRAHAPISVVRTR